ncbi:DUF4377 domain-containing protein [Polyangium fumosum]|uniref:DUF4377 domain-containing protein n=1 Tax=Polyangium fumosum TaxID=889272 RepID=A0A4V5PPU1_9BACT|nr:DUF4377 domain-containing protein [Polyangium fumosum]TKD08934.1 DUF4377 domain-containing protein [Polyangium fumosum]
MPGNSHEGSRQVREADNKEWERFYGRIEGFPYEEGYAYELRVKREPVANPPADASSVKTRLVKIVSKKKP